MTTIKEHKRKLSDTSTTMVKSHDRGNRTAYYCVIQDATGVSIVSPIAAYKYAHTHGLHIIDSWAVVTLSDAELGSDDLTRTIYVHNGHLWDEYFPDVWGMSLAEAEQLVKDIERNV